MKRFMCSDQRGFSLTELAVVVAIIAIIATIGTPLFLGMKTRSSIRADARDVHSAFRMAQTVAVKDSEITCVRINEGAKTYTLYDNSGILTRDHLRPGNSFVLAAKAEVADYFSKDPCFDYRGLPDESGAFKVTNDTNLLTMRVQLTPSGHVRSVDVP